MATLYNIDQALLECCDSETGEIIDAERLENLMMERDSKIESVALWVKNLESDAVAYKAEKEAFALREKAALNKAEQLKKWIAEATGGQKHNYSRCAISFRRSEVVEVIDAERIPKEYLVEKLTVSPDKVTIKAAIKGGTKVDGCILREKINTSIK